MSPPRPLWVGCNSELLPNLPEVVQIWYLSQINLSPTSFTVVVVETLNRAKQIASERGKENITVMVELAIAKMAKQIQAAEALKYDNVFVD